MNEYDAMPVKTWYASVGLLTLTIMMTAGLLIVSLIGVNDSRPVGALVVDDHFEISPWQLSTDDSTRMQVSKNAEGQYQVTVRAGTNQILGIAPYDIHPPCTLELSAVQVNGQEDAGYGLWWGWADQAPDILVGLTGNGYLAILPGNPEAGTPVRDWQLFPHIQPPGQMNVLRADITRKNVIVRINDEIAGQIEPGWSERSSAGFFIRASQHGDVTIQFLSFKVWQKTLSVR